MARGKLIVVSGPSGVGKGTILARVRQSQKFPLVMSVSATTRPPRQGEQEGVDYHFLSRGEFLRRKSAEEFLECFEVFPGGDWYGTLRETVETGRKQGAWVVLEIDVKGALEVMRHDPQVLSIFISPPDRDTLESRLQQRGSESAESMQKRLAQAQSEMSQSHRYQYVILNDNLDRATAEFSHILELEQSKQDTPITEKKDES